MPREAPSALSVTFFGAGPIFRLFSAMEAQEALDQSLALLRAETVELRQIGR